MHIERVLKRIALPALRRMAVAVDLLPTRRRHRSPNQLLPISGPEDEQERRRLRIRGPRTFTCALCARRSPFTWGKGSLRETVVCFHCGAYNRQRQIALVILRDMGYSSVRQMSHEQQPLRIYNTEANGPIHESLRSLPGYRASEYFGPEYRSGQLVGDVEHQDLCATSLPDGSFDLVISSDVMEHIADAEMAQREVFRILAPGGRHIMTAPFNTTSLAEEVLAVEECNGHIRHLGVPEMHGDRLRPEGIVSFRRFGVANLVGWESLGFEVRCFQLRDPSAGVVGRHALVFELTKPLTIPSG